MRMSFAMILGFTLVVAAAAAQQSSATTSAATAGQPAVTTGDRSTPLRPLTGAGNVGISNAVMRDQADVRVLRVMVEPGGTRVKHAHTDVKFHLFVPVSGPMMLTVNDGPAVVVQPWQPFYMKAGTMHAFHNAGTAPVEIMEIFVKP